MKRLFPKRVRHEKCKITIHHTQLIAPDVRSSFPAAVFTHAENPRLVPKNSGSDISIRLGPGFLVADSTRWTEPHSSLLRSTRWVPRRPGPPERSGPGPPPRGTRARGVDDAGLVFESAEREQRIRIRPRTAPASRTVILHSHGAPVVSLGHWGRVLRGKKGSVSHHSSWALVVSICTDPLIMLELAQGISATHRTPRRIGIIGLP